MFAAPLPQMLSFDDLVDRLARQAWQSALGSDTPSPPVTDFTQARALFEGSQLIEAGPALWIQEPEVWRTIWNSGLDRTRRAVRLRILELEPEFST